MHGWRAFVLSERLVNTRLAAGLMGVDRSSEFCAHEREHPDVVGVIVPGNVVFENGPFKPVDMQSENSPANFQRSLHSVSSTAEWCGHAKPLTSPGGHREWREIRDVAKVCDGRDQEERKTQTDKMVWTSSVDG
eukprot:444439_1